MKKKYLLISPLLALLVIGCSTNNSPNEESSSSEQIIINERTAKQVFKEAKENTIDSNQYSYDFNVTAKIKFKNAVSFSPAVYSGTTYVDTSRESTQFLQVRNLSGALVIDSTNYIYNVGQDLVKISADEDKDFNVINHETVSSTYDFDKYNFGYILKSLNDDGFLNAEYSETDKRYNLTLSTNFNQDSLLSVLNFIDSQTILKALNSYTKDKWGVSFSVNTWATVTEDATHLAKFHFDASVVIKDAFEIGFDFEQVFTKYSNVQLQLPTFSNTITSQSEINSELNAIKQVFDNSKLAACSYYDYDVKTTVDHGVSKANPLGLAVNSRTQGYTKRAVEGEDVFFNNRLEVDSDYKNSDQLGDLVEDYDSYRARLNNSNKDVYDVLDPKVGFNQYTLLSDFDNDDIDEYYMLPSNDLLSFENIKVIKKTTDGDSNTIYKFGLSNDAIKKILVDYNKSFRIDYTRETVFDIFDIDSGFNAKKAAFVVTVTPENKIKSIDIDLKGFYVEKESEDQVKYRLEVEIDYDWAKSYTPATVKEDIDNN